MSWSAAVTDGPTRVAGTEAFPPPVDGDRNASVLGCHDHGSGAGSGGRDSGRLRGADEHRAGSAGSDRGLDAGGQARLRHGDRRDQQGLVHPRARRADRGLLPRPGHAQPARPAVPRHRRRHVRRPRAGRDDLGGAAGRPEEPDLPAGGYGDQRPVPDHQDVRDRPEPVDGPARRLVPVADRPPLPGLRVRRPVADQRRHGRQRQLRLRSARRHRRPRGQRGARHPGLRPDLLRLPRHQRRLGRPALRLRPRRPLQLGPERERRADRAAEGGRPRAAARDAGRGLREHRHGGHLRCPGLPDRRLPRRLVRLCGRLALLLGLAQASAGLPGHGGPAADVRRLADGARRLRGQGQPRRLRRLTHDALGLGHRAGEPLWRLSPGLEP